MLLERLKIIIDNQFFFGKELTPEVRLIEDLGADSFDSLILVNSIEEEFKVSIIEAEIEGVRTIGDIISIIESKLKEDA